MKKNKGLSTVIATVLIILLVTISIGIVWKFISNIVNPDELEKAHSCFDVESSNTVTINSYYTCYNETFVQFSISIEDVDIDGLVVTILTGGNSKSFTLTNDLAVIANLKYYEGAYGNNVSLPGKNEGKTYVAQGFGDISKVDSIKIAPIVDGKQCGQSDATYQIDACYLFVN